MNCNYYRRLVFIQIIFMFALASKASASEDLLRMSPRELSNIKVTSVSKQKENASEAASAVYVLTKDKIRRMGVTSIPEALRMVPGLFVANIDSNKWVVSSRGFSGQFANKLLVLIDGRSVYTPLSSGVYWDTQNVLLEDIDRIEVIRGSGGTLWGANAVNGVINIITQHSQYTQGTFGSLGIGNYEQNGSARYGGKFGDKGHYRAYVQAFKRGDTETPSGISGHDEWEMTQGGIRTDWEPSPFDSITIQGDTYHGRKEWLYTLPNVLPSASPTFTQTNPFREKLWGGNILGKWKHSHSETAESELQLYYDIATRDSFALEQTIHTFDADYQNFFKVGNRNNVVWGVGVRSILFNLNPSFFIDYSSSHSSEQLYSAFFQDKIDIIPDKLSLTLGSKFEYNEHTNFEFQPNVRGAWKISENQTLWSAVSRTTRTPSLSEDTTSIVVSQRITPDLFDVDNDTNTLELMPVLLRWVGSNNTESEEVISYELGYRIQPLDRISVDATAFFNDYDNLRTLEQGPVGVSALISPHYTIPLTSNNKADGEVYGLEIDVNWDITKRWNVAGNYSLLRQHLHLDSDSTDPTFENGERTSPKNQIKLRSNLDLPYNVEFDNFFYFIDNLGGVKNYIRFDTRIGWKPIDQLEFSLIGHNLLDDYHQEHTSGLYTPSVEIGRSVFGQMKVRF